MVARKQFGQSDDTLTLASNRILQKTVSQPEEQEIDRRQTHLVISESNVEGMMACFRPLLRYSKHEEARRKTCVLEVWQIYLRMEESYVIHEEIISAASWQVSK